MRPIIRMVMTLIGVAAFISPATAGAAGSTSVNGFYNGRTIHYLNFGPIHLARGNKVAPIWSVTNGVGGQHNIVDVVPGQAAYTPLWRVVTVTFRPGVKHVLVRSAAQVRSLQRAHEITLKRTNTIVNCPVLGFGQKHVAGYYKGRAISYLDLGPVKLAAGNKVAPLWTVTNGTAGQHNIVDVKPGDRGYSPLWSINEVTWTPGAAKTTLTSLAAVRAAKAAGKLTVKSTPTVVNCPVLSGGTR